MVSFCIQKEGDKVILRKAKGGGQTPYSGTLLIFKEGVGGKH